MGKKYFNAIDIIIMTRKVCKKTFVNVSRIVNLVNVFFRESFPLYGYLTHLITHIMPYLFQNGSVSTHTKKLASFSFKQVIASHVSNFFKILTFILHCPQTFQMPSRLISRCHVIRLLSTQNWVGRVQATTFFQIGIANFDHLTQLITQVT